MAAVPFMPDVEPLIDDLVDFLERHPDHEAICAMGSVIAAKMKKMTAEQRSAICACVILLLAEGLQE